MDRKRTVDLKSTGEPPPELARQPAAEPAAEPAPEPAVPPPGRVQGMIGGKPPTGLPGLRSKLNLSDRTGLDDVTDSALGLIAQLEDELSKPPRGDRLELQPRSISLQL